jgi:uncharacterized membrane protein YbhN (UPF0104 family)
MTDPTNQDSLNNDYQAPTLWGWPTYLSIIIAIIILIFAARMVDLKEIWREIAACDKRYVILGSLAHYATYPVRGMRWRKCLIHLPVTAGSAKFGLLVFFYNFVDNLVPAKLGDVYAAHLARINFKIRRSAAMGSIVFLRMIDAWIILMLASLASWILFAAHLPRAVTWSLVGGGIIAVGATSIMLLFFIFKKKAARLDTGKNSADDSSVSYRHVAPAKGVITDRRLNPQYLGAGNHMDILSGPGVPSSSQSG